MCILGGELYIGLYTDYWENDGALCRLNNQTYTRTERNDRSQLNGWCTLQDCNNMSLLMRRANMSIWRGSANCDLLVSNVTLTIWHTCFFSNIASRLIIMLKKDACDLHYIIKVNIHWLATTSKSAAWVSCGFGSWAFAANALGPLVCVVGPLDLTCAGMCHRYSISVGPPEFRGMHSLLYC